MHNDGNLANPVLDSSGISLERKRRDDEAAWFNELYLLAPVGYFVVAFDSKILLANLVGAEMLGIPRADPGAHRFRAFIGAASAAEFDTFIGRALNSHTPERCRVQMRRAGGVDEFPVTLLASADGSGQACRVVVEPASSATWRAAARPSPSAMSSSSCGATAAMSGPRWRPTRSSTAPAPMSVRWRWSPTSPTGVRRLT